MSHNIIIRQLKCHEIQTPVLSSVHNRLWLIIRKGTTIALPFNNHQLQITIITPARTLKYTRSDRNELASMRHQLRGSAVSVPSRPQIRNSFSNNINSRITPWEPRRNSSIWWMILMITMGKYLVKWAATRSDREARMTTTGTQCKTRVTRVLHSSRWKYCETPHSIAPATRL